MLFNILGSKKENKKKGCCCKCKDEKAILDECFFKNDSNKGECDEYIKKYNDCLKFQESK